VYSFFRTVEYKSFDLRFQLRGALPKSDISDKIVLVDYDTETQQWAPFPPDRTYYAEIIKALGDEKTKTVATFFDIFFFDPFGRQLDPVAADMYKGEFHELSAVTQSDGDITGNVKQELFTASEQLASATGSIATARQDLQAVANDAALKDQVAKVGNVLDFFHGDPELKTLAPDRDERMRDALKAAAMSILLRSSTSKTPLCIMLTTSSTIHKFIISSRALL